MKLPQILAIMVLVSAFAAYAINLDYVVTASGTDLNNNSVTFNQSVSETCSNECTFAMPSFSIPANTTINIYDLSYSSTEFTAVFESTKDKLTTSSNDRVQVNVIQTQAAPAPQGPVCSDKQCDKSCTVCSDNSCHDSGFTCAEQMNILKIFPTTINAGSYIQLNTQIENTGTVAFSNVYVEFSGDGITTIDKTPIDTLKPGNSDYAFTIINASKGGTIDVVVKIYANNELKNKFADQLTVIPQQEENPNAQFNSTQLSSTLDELRNRYKMIEQDYENKKKDSYPVDFVYDKLTEAYNQLTDAQSNILNGNLKEANTELTIAKTSLDDVQQQLSTVQKPKASFFDTFKQNLLYIGSLAAALVSMFTMYTIIRSHMEKVKLLKLNKKLRFKPKKLEKHK